MTRLNKKKKAIILISSILVISLLFSLVAFGGAILSQEIISVTQGMPLQQQNLQASVTETLNMFTATIGGRDVQLSQFIQPTHVTSYFSTIIPGVMNALTAIFSEFILVLLFLMFLLPSHDLFFERISKGLPRKNRTSFKRTLFQIEDSIRQYLVTKTVVSLMTAVLSAMVMYFFGVKFIFVFSLLFFAFNFIPNIGSFFAVVMVLISHFLFVGFGWPLVALALLLTVIQFIIGNVVDPKLTGDKLDLSPVVVLLALFFWGYVWGIPGMFFAVPLTSIMKIVLQNIKSTKHVVSFLS